MNHTRRERKQVSAGGRHKSWCLATKWRTSFTSSRLASLTHNLPNTSRPIRAAGSSKIKAACKSDDDSESNRCSNIHRVRKTCPIIIQLWGEREEKNDHHEQKHFSLIHQHTHRNQTGNVQTVWYENVCHPRIDLRIYEYHPNKNNNSSKAFQTEEEGKKIYLRHKITWNSCISDLDYAAYKKVHSTGTSIMEQTEVSKKYQ